MKVYFAADHAGFTLKQILKEFVSDELGHDVKDFGADRLSRDDDYPDYVFPAARAVANDAHARAIILGGSGQGEAMAANRIRRVRAAVWYGGDTDIIALSREHNNANVLSIGARFVEADDAKKVVAEWLDTRFKEEARHVRRIEKLDGVHSA